MAEQMIRITSGDVEFLARMEPGKSPKTCEAFLSLLPYEQKMIHVRWSGESCWIPLGDFDLGVPFADEVTTVAMLALRAGVRWVWWVATIARAL